MITEDANVMKVCSTCKEPKPQTLEFYRRDRTNKTCGLMARCRTCEKKWKQDHYEEQKESQRRYREKRPRARRATGMVRDALASGALVRQPCEICGDEKAQAHHDDYSKPLDVRWLCHDHHVDFHRDFQWEYEDLKAEVKRLKSAVEERDRIARSQATTIRALSEFIESVPELARKAEDEARAARNREPYERVYPDDIQTQGGPCVDDIPLRDREEGK